ncbi:hypothetical protein ACWGKW_34055 [Streptomyces sp. NPDC054766]
MQIGIVKVCGGEVVQEFVDGGLVEEGQIPAQELVEDLLDLTGSKPDESVMDDADGGVGSSAGGSGGFIGGLAGRSNALPSSGRPGCCGRTGPIGLY